jgi:hypothetical protein
LFLQHGGSSLPFKQMTLKERETVVTNHSDLWNLSDCFIESSIVAAAIAEREMSGVFQD